MRTLSLFQYLLKDVEWQVALAFVLILVQAIVRAMVTLSIGSAIDLVNYQAANLRA